MDFKHRIHVEEEKDGKKCEFICDNGTNFGAIYDFSMEIRNFALENMKKAEEQEKKEEEKKEKEDEKAGV